MSILELSIDFNRVVAAGAWFALAVVLLSLLLVLRASQLRRAAVRRDADVAGLRERWETLRAVPRKYALEWMLLWNGAHEAASARTDAQKRRANLNSMAARIGMRTLAHAWSRRGDVVDRLAAIAMLGHLRDASAVPVLRLLCESRSALISIAAARALLQIEPRFADRFVAMIAARSDWAPGKLAAVIREQCEVLTAPLLELCRTTPIPVTRAAVLYLRYLRAEKAIPVLRHVLRTVADAETLAAALKVIAAVGSPAEAALVTKFAADERWQVRVQAANALGALGGESHIPLLAAMLSDRHWWVRYRAAQAAAAIADRCSADLAPVLAQREDPFARDALTQAMAERAVLAPRGAPS